MTEEKRKRGRPRKIKLEDLNFNSPHATIPLIPPVLTQHELLPEAEIIALAEAAKGDGVPTAYDAEKFYVTGVDEFKLGDSVSLEFVPGTRVDYDNPPPDEFHPSKMEAVVSIMEDVALAKKHIERLKKKPEYSPYDNPRFKSKNNLK